MNARSFHIKCDLKGHTLIIIKSKVHNRIFGGFTTLAWKSSHGEWMVDTNKKGFLFSISSRTIHPIIDGQ